MITSIVGRTFLDAYNKKYETNFSAKQFFEEVYFELFYNHPKYLQWVTNSPFVQMKSGQKVEKLSVEERKEKLLSLYEKVANEEPDASFVLGFPASEVKEYASTSGLVSDIKISTSEDDIYLSWIGSGLGIGVAGGFTLLFDDAAIALQTFEGWRVYRKYLNDEVLNRLRGNQINTWNGQWLTYSLGTEFKSDFDFTRLESEGIFKVDTNLIEINTVNWSQLFFSISQLYANTELTAYVYGFGQTNKTIGFIPFQFKSGNKIKVVYNKLFSGDYQINKKQFESLFGMHIKRACELGSIGLQALRPDSLKKYMNENKNLTFNKEEDTIIYHAYKTWLVAMLTKNKEEITDYTLELAGTILRYRNAGSKTDRKNLIEQDLLGAKSKKGFIEALSNMIKDLGSEDLDSIKKLKDEVHLMTNEEFGYFCTLLKFDYAFVEKKS
ncbi:hypothetical protein GALL_64650 [mine drainage metagenome]|uniref:Uncharacterized protein n=1 Tax=mine drainage metagenome TaxID=410659 RepID=A0A1J5TEM6_9ZZZZ